MEDINERTIVFVVLNFVDHIHTGLERFIMLSFSFKSFVFIFAFLICIWFN